MFKRGNSDFVLLLGAVFCAMVLVSGAVWTVAAEEIDSARCERTSDLKHWRCEVTCSSGEAGIATCPTQSAWGACGRQVLHQACGISETTPSVACVRKHVLAGSNLDELKTACDQSYGGFNEILEGPLEVFPGLAYRPAE